MEKHNEVQLFVWLLWDRIYEENFVFVNNGESEFDKDKSPKQWKSFISKFSSLVEMVGILKEK